MSTPGSGGQLPPEMLQKLDEVRRHDRRIQVQTGLVRGAAILLAAMLAGMAIDWLLVLHEPALRWSLTLLMLAAAGYGLVRWSLLPLFSSRSAADCARDVDRAHPFLEERYQTMTGFAGNADAPELRGSPALIRKVSEQAAALSPDVAPASVISRAGLLRASRYALIAVGVLVVLFAVDFSHMQVLLRRFWQPGAAISQTILTAKTGDITIGKGENVALEFVPGGKTVQSVALRLRPAKGGSETVKLRRNSAADTAFVYTQNGVTESFQYQARAGDGETAWHEVTVVDRPKLAQVQLKVVPPAYSKLPTVEEKSLPRQMRALEGSQLEVSFQSDQPLESLSLRFGDGSTHPLTASSNRFYRFNAVLSNTFTFQPILTNPHHMNNVDKPSCEIAVYKDEPPSVHIISPDEDITAQPEEKIKIDVEMTDDIGLASADLVVNVTKNGTNAPPLVIPIPFTEKEEGARQVRKQVELDLGKLDLKQDEELTYYVRALDTKQSAASSATPSDRNNLAANSQNQQQPNNATNPNNGQTGGNAGATNNPANGNQGALTQQNQPNQAQQNPAQSNNGQNQGQNQNQTGAQNQNANGGQNGSQNQPNNQALAQNQGGQNQAGQTNQSLGLDQNQNGQTNQPQNLAQNQGQNGAQNQAGAPGRNQNQNGAQNQNAGQKQNGSQNQTGSRNQQSNQSGAMAQNSDGQPNQSQGQQSNSGQNQNQNQGQNGAQNQNGQNQPQNENQALAQNQNGNQNNNTNGNQSGQPSNQSQSQSQSQNGSNSGGQSQAQNQNNGGTNQPSNEAQAVAQNDLTNQPANPNRIQIQAKNPAGGSNQVAQSGSRNGSPSQNQQQQQQGAQPQDPNASQPPSNDMNKRSLDVAGSSSSQQMRIKVDEWAGSFAGKQREKLEIAIDPVLKLLDELLGKAQASTDPVLAQAKSPQGLGDAQNAPLESARDNLRQADRAVSDLRTKTDGTPYAFIGLQIRDIRDTHMEPARQELVAVTLARDNGPSDLTNLQQASFHIQAARLRLADLSRTYETQKRDLKLADAMQHLQKMHQIFIEDTQALLGGGKQPINNPQRKVAEVSDEFAEKLKKLMEEEKDIMAELAKALADDPRLLRRFLAMQQMDSTTLRDQMTLLNRSQTDLAQQIERWMAAPDTDHAAFASNYARSQAREQIQVATLATKLQEDLSTWWPLDVTNEPDAIIADRKLAADAARLAVEAAMQTNLDASLATAGQALDKLRAIHSSIPDLTADEETGPKLAVFAANRDEETGTLITRESGWMRKMEALRSNDVPTAVAVDQHRVAVETTTLQQKLDAMSAAYSRLSLPIKAKSDELNMTMHMDVIPAVTGASDSLEQKALKDAAEMQTDATNGFAKAETEFDELLKLLIDKLDEAPPPTELGQNPTLDDLLESLKRERKLADSLGIPNRPINVAVMRDWMRPSQSQQQQQQAQGRTQAQAAERQARDNKNRTQRDEEKLREYARAHPPENTGVVTTNTATMGPKRGTASWNTLVSQLGDELRQGRDNVPPEQYRQAIEQYFNAISDTLPPTPATPPPATPNPPNPPQH